MHQNVVVVTGAAGNLGRAVTGVLAARGCRLAIIDRTVESLESVAAELPKGADYLALPGVDPKILTPRETWADVAAYDKMAADLVGMFQKNFERFASQADTEVLSAGPVSPNKAAAE